jgi:hypothetical protein
LRGLQGEAASGEKQGASKGGKKLEFAHKSPFPAKGPIYYRNKGGWGLSVKWKRN